MEEINLKMDPTRSTRSMCHMREAFGAPAIECSNWLYETTFLRGSKASGLFHCCLTLVVSLMQVRTWLAVPWSASEYISLIDLDDDSSENAVKRRLSGTAEQTGGSSTLGICAARIPDTGLETKDESHRKYDRVPDRRPLDATKSPAKMAFSAARRGKNHVAHRHSFPTRDSHWSCRA